LFIGHFIVQIISSIVLIAGSKHFPEATSAKQEKHCECGDNIGTYLRP